jgi:hypothetical protein
LTFIVAALAGWASVGTHSANTASTAPMTPTSNDGTAAVQGPIVVLITIDGFPARALKDPRLLMPALRMLEANGAHC